MYVQIGLSVREEAKDQVSEYLDKRWDGRKMTFAMT